MNNIFKYLTIAAITLFAVGSVYAGGGTRTGTAGQAQLLVPVGPRGIAMAGSDIASATGIEALFWNPAGVSKLGSSAELTFSHQNYIADINVEYGAVGAYFKGFGVLALSIKSLGIGEIPITTTVNPDGTGATFSPRNITVGITFARRLTDQISIGVTANLVSETLDQVDANGFAFNFGVSYSDVADVSGLNLGVVMTNLGAQQQFTGPGLLGVVTQLDEHRTPTFRGIQSAKFDLPSQFKIGLSYKGNLDDDNAITLASTFINNNFEEDTYRIGIEYSYDNALFLRGGYQTRDKNSQNFIYDWSGGIGFNYDLSGTRIMFDYAYQHSEFFGGNHTVGVSLGF